MKPMKSTLARSALCMYANIFLNVFFSGKNWKIVLLGV